MQKFDVLSLRLPGVITYFSSDKRRPWLTQVANKILKGKKVEIYNYNQAFYNFIDTIEIYKFLNFLIRKKGKMEKGSINFSCKKPLKIKHIISQLKSHFLSKSKVINKKSKNINFKIISNKCYKNYNFKIANASTVINRYISDLKTNTN